MTFAPDQRFDSLKLAFEFIFSQYALRSGERLWLNTSSGLMIPHDAPRYLFRGECGEFETTTPAFRRPGTYCLKNGRPLSAQDLHTLRALIPHLARRFSDSDYSLDGHSAIGLLQHYGLPTWLIDFTAHLGYAFAFAVAGSSPIGRIAVLPLRAFTDTGGVVNLMEHPWAERPRRQAAFGMITTEEVNDLK